MSDAAATADKETFNLLWAVSMSQAHWHIPSSEEELISIFFEEAGELLENIDIHLKAWRNDLGDKNALSEIRRSFHTLKGSGRMVKALDLADIAWRVENMLNQAIAGAVPASMSMVQLVASVRTKIPRIVDAMKNGRSIAKNSDIVSLVKLADALAAGRGPSSVSVPMPTTDARGKQQVKPSELSLKLERFMQRADEALHRSEMALQQARRTSTQIEALHLAVTQQDCRAGVNRIGERVDLLSREVSDVRHGSKKSQTGSSLHQNEMKQLVNKQVKASLAPTELLLYEIKREIEENRRTLTAVGRFRWIALVLSATIGGLIATGLFMSTLSLD